MERAGATPEDEYRLARSALAMPPMLGRDRTPGALVTEPAAGSMVPLSTLSGRLSRLPPNMEAGANARIEALVSTEFRRRRLEEDASVRMDASSVRTLLAVADVYVAG